MSGEKKKTVKWAKTWTIVQLCRGCCLFLTKQTHKKLRPCWSDLTWRQLWKPPWMKRMPQNNGDKSLGSCLSATQLRPNTHMQRRKNIIIFLVVLACQTVNSPLWPELSIQRTTQWTFQRGGFFLSYWFRQYILRETL